MLQQARGLRPRVFRMTIATCFRQVARESWDNPLIGAILIMKSLNRVEGLLACAFGVWRAVFIKLSGGAKVKSNSQDRAAPLFRVLLLNGKEPSEPFDAFLYHPFDRNKRLNER